MPSPTPAAVSPNNIYIGERYVPIYGGAWDTTKTYESLTIVTNDNDTYISNRPVPANTPLTNTTYWAKMFGGNQQLEEVTEQVNGFQAELDALETKIDSLGQGGYVWKPSMIYNIMPGTDITTAISALTSDENIGFSAGEYTISSEITINARCYFAPGAVLKSTANVTFTQPIVVEGAYQVFNVNNPASPVLYNIPNTDIRPEWYGAKVTNTDYYFFNAAIASAPSVFTLRLSPVTYNLDGAITVGKTCNIVGNGATLNMGANGSFNYTSTTPFNSVTITGLKLTNAAEGRTTAAFNFQSVVYNLNFNNIQSDIGVYALTSGSTVCRMENFYPVSSLTIANLSSTTTATLRMDIDNIIMTTAETMLTLVQYSTFSPDTQAIICTVNRVLGLADNCVLQLIERPFTCYSCHNITVRGKLRAFESQLTFDSNTIPVMLDNCNITQAIIAGESSNPLSFSLAAIESFKNVTINASLTLDGTNPPTRTLLDNVTVTGTVTMTGNPNATAKVTLINCNFGASSVSSNTGTFVFVNSPWGEISLNNTDFITDTSMALFSKLGQTVGLICGVYKGQVTTGGVPARDGYMPLNVSSGDILSFYPYIFGDAQKQISQVYVGLTSAIKCVNGTISQWASPLTLSPNISNPLKNWGYVQMTSTLGSGNFGIIYFNISIMYDSSSSFTIPRQVIIYN